MIHKIYHITDSLRDDRDVFDGLRLLRNTLLDYTLELVAWQHCVTWKVSSPDLGGYVCQHFAQGDVCQVVGKLPFLYQKVQYFVSKNIKG